MPDLTQTYVGANYRQQIVPFSRFGTRKVVWYKIGAADLDSEPGVLDMVTFNKVIETIQTRAEIVMVGAPYITNDNQWNKFMIAVFEDTFNNGNNTDPAEYYNNSQASTLQSALQQATGQGSIYVEQYYLYGAPGASGPQGWSSNSTYREYDTKGEFVDNSYVF